MVNIQPIKSKLQLDVLTGDQVAEIRTATLHILKTIGVHFPSERALQVFSENGAQVDTENQIVRLPPEMVLEVMGNARRVFTISGRVEGTNLILDGSASHFSTDGSGTETIDFKTGEYRPSTKADVAMIHQSLFIGRSSARRITGAWVLYMSWMLVSTTPSNTSRVPRLSVTNWRDMPCRWLRS
jgi:trimethylamine:corrinoid methyltransferase-like protein